MKRLPFYSEHGAPDKRPDKSTASNAGLWFDRFFNEYEADFTVPSTRNQSSPRTDWLKANFGQCGDDAQLFEYTLGQYKLVSQLNGVALAFKLNGDMVTGTGNPHPVENGFTWHPTLGTPYIQGSTVKGLLRHQVEQYFIVKGEDKEISEDLRREVLLTLFGSNTKNIQNPDYKSQAGGLICFDALPMRSVTLGLSVMTPHLGKWYEQGKAIESESANPEVIPADWHDPIPISYLTVKQSAVFMFSMAVRSGSEISDKGLSEAFVVLTEALKHSGVGAKTNVGFGRMHYVKNGLDDVKQALKREADEEEFASKQRRAAASGVSALYTEFLQAERDEEWSKDPELFKRPPLIENWLAKLEEQPDKATLFALKDLLVKHLPSAVKPAKKTRSRQRKIAERLAVLIEQNESKP